eukprot:scaffold4900_cov193-Alexandrium_tamarense.AAC.29
MECRLDELGANAVMCASFASSSRNDRYLECGVMMPVCNAPPSCLGVKFRLVQQLTKQLLGMRYSNTCRDTTIAKSD